EVPLDDVIGTRRARHLIDIVLHGRPDKGMTAQPPEPVRRAFQLLRSMSVDEVADGLGFSSRHLRRLVVEHSGLGPKTYQRVVRLRHFLADDGPLAQAATNAGYADQAHLTREVTRLCGVSPTVTSWSRASPHSSPKPASSSSTSRTARSPITGPRSRPSTPPGRSPTSSGPVPATCTTSPTAASCPSSTHSSRPISMT